MTNKQALKTLVSLRAVYEDTGADVLAEALSVAIESVNAIANLETLYASDSKKPLKIGRGEYVTYYRDYLLQNLAREIYLLESQRQADKNGQLLGGLEDVTKN